MTSRTVISAFLLLAAWACTSRLSAQGQVAAQDQVFLKTGASYSGIIVEQKPGESIRLWRTAEADTLMFDMETIDRITKIVPLASTATTTPAATITPLKTFNSSPWKVALQAGTGGGDYPVATLGASVYRYFPRQRAWLGLGAQYIGDQSSRGTSSLPVFVHGTYELATPWKGRLATGVFAELGYSFNMDERYFDDATQATLRYGNGLHSYAGLRFRVNILRNAGIWADLGYLRHSSRLSFDDTGEKARVQSWNVFLLRGSIFF